MPRLVRLTDHVLVTTSQLYTTTTTVVLGHDGDCLLVDPAITPSDLAALAADLADRGLRVAAAFATHPHWDHVLWSAALGTAPRFATAAAAEVIARDRGHHFQLAEQAAPGHDPALFGVLTALPPGTVQLTWNGPAVQVVEHRAHTPGHAALRVPDDGVLLAGDMCSDIEIPLLDLDADEPIGDYRRALELFSELDDIEHVVPGHGTVGDAAAWRRRLDADRRYLDELQAGRGDDDPRLTEEWLVRDHHAHVAAIMSTQGRPSGHDVS